MPANNHLEWLEIRDFRPGLWTTNDLLMPRSAAQEMVDCYPDKAGGLRAFFGAGTGADLPGLTGLSPSTEKLMGLWYSWGTTQHALCRVNSTNTWKHYTTPTGPTSGATWTLQKTHANTMNSSDPGHWVDYMTSGGTHNVVTNVPGNGIWMCTYAGLSFTQLTTDQSPFLCVHQSRLVIRSATLDNTLKWTDPGGTTFPAANTLTLEPGGAGDRITWVVSSTASDLYVGTLSGRIFAVQGDLSDPVVRQLVPGGYTVIRSASPGNPPALGPDGSIYVASYGKDVQRFRGGATEPVSSALDPRKVYAADGAFWLGGSGYTDVVRGGGRFLFCPNGVVYDLETESWFRSSVLKDAEAFVNMPESYGQIIYAQRDVLNWALGTMLIVPDQSTGFSATLRRAADFTWKSAPLRSPDGRQMAIREVQVVCNDQSGGTATVTVTVNGTARAVNPGSGRQVIPFLFKEREEMLDVTVRSQTSSGEAPSIESVRIGYRPTHLL